MDTSETYILQCQKATEIQEIWEPEDGDWFWDGKDVRVIGEEIRPNREKSIVGYDWGYDYEDREEFVTAIVCLFRQDQLQAMVFEGQQLGESLPCAMLKLLYEFGHVAKNKDAAYWHGCQSMEQLWLAFVMWTKYNKKWSGSDWTK